MTNESPLFSVSTLSTQFADAVDAAAASVIQVQGRRRPASGLSYKEDVVLTMARALGREDGITVRDAEGQSASAELAGWDPATGLAVLRVSGLRLRPAVLAAAPPRVGNLALGVARSWSNALTASAGIVSVIGGPLRTGRRRSIDEVIRTSAPMHDGFAGGALIDVAGGLLGMPTAAAIRGLGVVIPAPIVWKTAETLLEHGTVKRGYLGLAGQPVVLPEHQREVAGRERAVLVVGVTAASPAAAAGIVVGDVIVDFEGRPVESPEDLLDLLNGARPGQSAALRLLRGGKPFAATVQVGERTAE